MSRLPSKTNKVRKFGFLFAGLITSMAAASTAYAGYGAIAYNTGNGATGRSWNHPSANSALRAAQRQCAGSCRSFWFRNACGAVAMTPNGGFGYAWAVGQSAARNSAMRNCRSHNARGCSIRAWQCTN